ncbi:MAG TPA: M1 family aminopeptidase, partial [Anaerolineaceae bacterium]|nr:M1 family aminopeptidase [Anaerolineaceae bacterium]
NDQALEPWLDEAMATYSEEIYYEKTYPEALDWWWNYRVRYYEPRGWVDTSIYNPYKSAQPYRDYRDAVYLNGAEFLNELRQTIGDEAFFAFLHDYAAAFQGQLVHRADFFTVLARHSSLDLTALVQKYFSQ